MTSSIRNFHRYSHGNGTGNPRIFMFIATEVIGERNRKPIFVFFQRYYPSNSPPPKKRANEARIRKRRKHMTPSLKKRPSENRPHFCICGVRLIFVADSIKTAIVQNGPILRSEDHRVSNHCTIAWETCASLGRTKQESMVLLKKHCKIMHTETTHVSVFRVSVFFLACTPHKKLKTEGNETGPQNTFLYVLRRVYH